MADIKVYHIPVCPFSLRLEILLALKGTSDQVSFQVIDITEPRPPWLLEKTGGTTSLPVLETAAGQIIKESLVILQYLEDLFPVPAVAQQDPYRRAVENMLTQWESDFSMAVYRYVMNQSLDLRDECRDKMRLQYVRLNDFLLDHASHSTFLFEDFGWAEVVFTPFFMRFWFLEYYEGFAIPEELSRVRRWCEAAVSHPAAQQVSREEIIKLYYDYAKGAGNGALLAGRQHSSFVFEPHWSARPWPPPDKYDDSASDQELGLM